MSMLRVFASTWIISINCESRQSFIININTPWIHTSYHDVNSEIKFEAIDQKWILNVSTNDTTLINWHLRYLINNVNSFALTRVLRLNDPSIILLLILNRMEMTVKIRKFIRQDVTIWDNIEFFFTIFLLHFNYIRY